MNKIFSLLLIITLFFSCKNEKGISIEKIITDNSFATITSLVDHFAEENLSKGNASAFAVAIYREGHMYQNYYGALNGDSEQQLNDDSLFEIASITKTFTGSLVAEAVLSGK